MPRRLLSHKTDETQSRRETKETRVLGTIKGRKVKISEVHFRNEGADQGKHVGTVRAVLTQ